MKETLQRIWAEPSAPNPPPQSWRDWLLALLLVGAGLAVILTDQGFWLPATLGLNFLGALLVPWRRAFPLATVAIGFAGYGAFHVARLVTQVDDRIVGSWALMVLLYALARWASGRHALIGCTLAAVAVGFATSRQSFDTTELRIGSLVYWTAPVLLGVALRAQAQLADTRILEARLNERHALARELHDTVAHHVSAMAIQAQAGRVAAAASPQAAVSSLKVIEDAASRSLSEMRRMVGALRDNDALELAPRHGLRDIERVALVNASGPRVEVELSGDLDDLEPSIEAGLFRLAIEAITNARRHARRATQIAVRIVGSASAVRLTVIDDGEPTAARARRRRPGYGIVGMAERVKILGGTFEGGPGPDRGWVVEAAVPRNSATS